MNRCKAHVNIVKNDLSHFSSTTTNNCAHISRIFGDHAKITLNYCLQIVKVKERGQTRLPNYGFLVGYVPNMGARINPHRPPASSCQRFVLKFRWCVGNLFSYYIYWI